MSHGTDSSRAVSIQLPAGPHATEVCRDFYDAVNAEWTAKTQLPVDSSDTTQAFHTKFDTISINNFGIVAKDVRRTLIAILTDARVNAATTRDPVTRVLGMFYNSCLIAPRTDSGPHSREKDGGVGRCVAATDEILGDALGRAYVTRVITPDVITRVRATADQLRATMAIRIRAIPWMSEETKKAALVKLAAMRFRVGNTELDSVYTQLVLSPTDYAGNEVKARYVMYQHSLAQRGRMSDKNSWRFRQYTTNAQYIPGENAIEVPAVLFQEPYFNPHADAVENYAGLFAIVGHEVTHAFDTNGAQYDSSGDVRNWWTDQDRERFLAQARKLVEQYDQFPVGDLHVDGAATVNENIADLGGVNLAFDMYMRSIRSRDQRRGRASSAQRGRAMTPEQRFFVAYAAIWRAKSSPLHERQLLAIDSHSPHKWRVNGILANLPAFAKAFGCKPGDPMALAPAARAEIW